MILNHLNLNYYREKKTHYKLIFDTNFGFVDWSRYDFIKRFPYLKGYVCLEFNRTAPFELWNSRGRNWMNMVYLANHLDQKV